MTVTAETPQGTATHGPDASKAVPFFVPGRAPGGDRSAAGPIPDLMVIARRYGVDAALAVMGAEREARRLERPAPDRTANPAPAVVRPEERVQAVRDRLTRSKARTEAYARLLRSLP